jgi:poly(hydroxyalkanoate) depolymerase family esterase
MRHWKSPLRLWARAPANFAPLKATAMKPILPEDLLKMTRLPQAGRLTDLTASLQRMLSASRARGGDGAVDLAQALRAFRDHIERPEPQVAPEAAPEGARFLAKTFSNHAGLRPYKLYVPNGYHGQAVPLIVMLHGCTQSPDDIAAGTRMNQAAEAHTCLVAYPAQTKTHNPQKCWNWFNADDQQRDGGEPSLIAGITRQVMGDHAIDPARVYVAGMSAGGAAAAIMGNAYPDLYAAIGVHSGLACGAARDVQSAFAVMQSGGHGIARRPGQRVVPTIVFHGERDTTVNARNGEAVVAQAVRGAGLRPRVQNWQVPGGYAYTLTQYVDVDGGVLVEDWLIRGAGHAWFGGSPAGSFTDPKGPDATAEMIRFFLAHRR